MSLPDQLSQLKDLHESGALTDGEYTAAKARVIESPFKAEPATSDIGRHMEQFLDLQRERFIYSKYVQWIGIIVALILAVAFISQGAGPVRIVTVPVSVPLVSRSS